MKRFKNVIKIALFLVTFAIHAQTPTTEIPDMTIVTVMESSHSMNMYAIKNIVGMVDGSKNHPHEKLTILVQWHAEGNIAWHLRIMDGVIFSEGIIEAGNNSAVDTINAMRWAVTHKAKKYGLILWNHGYGILTPEWDPMQHLWSIKPDSILPLECSVPSDYNNQELKGSNHKHRGIMTGTNTNTSPHTMTCMDNNEMVRALKTIYEEILDEEKLAFLAMDACLMAMIEIAYQAEPYVEYLIGSQDCELPDGFDYSRFIQELVHVEDIDGKVCASAIVDTFDRYYQPRALYGRYTQSALDLSLVKDLKENNDALMQTIITCMEYDKAFIDIICQRRFEEIKGFCMCPMYADLNQVYEVFQTIFENYQPDESLQPILDTMRILLNQGQNIISEMIVARAAGKASTHASGVSIYFPLSHIDPTYETSRFAQESAWYHFLQAIVGNENDTTL